MQKTKYKIYTFNSFFFTTLQHKGYNSVSHWASEIRGKALFQLDTIFIPVNQNCHWVLIVVHPGTQIIKEFNSLDATSSVYAHQIKQFLDREVSEEMWEVQCAFSPQQSNNYDCSAFLLTSARCIALGLPVNFNQSDIPNMQKRIVAELINNDIDTGKISIYFFGYGWHFKDSQAYPHPHMGAQVSDQQLLTKETDAIQFEVLKDGDRHLCVSLENH